MFEHLTVESQVVILERLADVGGWHIEDIAHKAVESRNEYIRYLGCRCVRGSSLTDSLKQRIEKDPSELVQSSLFELGDFDAIFNKNLKEPEKFWNLPKLGRAAMFRDGSIPGYKVAELFSWLRQGSDRPSIDEGEIMDLLWDYATSPGFKKMLRNAHRVYDEWPGPDDCQALWALVIALPGDTSYPLIEHLTADRSITSDVLEMLSDRQINWLLNRREVHLRDFRRKIYERPGEDNKGLREVALRWNFVESDGLSEVFEMPKDPRSRLLKDIVEFADDLTLTMYAAIRDTLRRDGEEKSARLSDDRMCKRGRWISNQPGYDVTAEVMDLRVYLLAERVLPWKQRSGVSETRDKDNVTLEDEPEPDPDLSLLEGDLQFLQRYLMANTWETYRHFADRLLHRSDVNVSALSKNLPDYRLTGVQLPPPSNLDVFNEVWHLRERENKMQNSFQESFRESATEADRRIIGLTNRIVKTSNSLDDTGLKVLDRIANIETTLKAYGTRLSLLIVLLLVMLVTTYLRV